MAPFDYSSTKHVKISSWMLEWMKVRMRVEAKVVPMEAWKQRELIAHFVEE